ncbi:YusW family protein [Virgibacillus oceani]
MKKWYIALLAALIILAGCGTEDNGTVDEGADIDQQDEVTTEEDQDQGEDGSDDSEANNQENGTQNGEGENGTSHGETAYERGVKNFELELDFQNNDKWEYEYEVNGAVEAEIEKDSGREGTEEAAEEIEVLLQNMVIDDSRSHDEMIDDILSMLDVSRDELDEFELEIDYEDGTQFQFEQNF